MNMSVTASSADFAHLETLKVRIEESVCYLQFHRPEANNAISAQLVAECSQVLDACEPAVSIVVLSGLPDVFCFGADFKEVTAGCAPVHAAYEGPGPMYDLWLRLATGPFVVISYVRGKANAGGLGFIGASDIVLADESAQFSLSELLFGLYPACVLPFLMRRIGFQKAHYLTLNAQAITAKNALDWGLVDACEAQGEPLLRRHVMRLRRLSRTALARYKSYASQLGPPLAAGRDAAVAGNLEVFTDEQNLRAIARYVQDGLFPWEQ
ncbi:polyketide biosynthesis enoyl-CoA hydratase PksH [Tahibacter aquaticus]|uniref:Polyketide biosynthesis enoyl-CoA hydratase PksH n=1 Tax=Tahibacter aquaticus TaxID=520092 RepID=A0A4R6Z084_9GAMM|nr:enoyl-CoA hydratase/isomerase [Tahibacter aquaticus]TDR44824.1 polyketide biosynthesis enoyl-CoA hydratase PksH [Tahibacter aquaticus]